MDRFERMIATGKASDVVAQARKWLERNIVDDRREAVVGLLHEAAYAVVLEKPTVAGVQEYQSQYPRSARLEDAKLLEANLSLYDADAEGTEAAYLDVADRYSGTPAAQEARSRAMNAAYAAAEKTGTSDAWGRFLSDYRDSTKADGARAVYRDLLWSEAEAADTVDGWLALRSSDPEHPRVAEALEREARLAVDGLADDAGFHDHNKLVRRYVDTDAGRDALARMADWAQIRVEGGLARGTGDTHDYAFLLAKQPVDPTIAALPQDTGTVSSIDGLTPHWPGPTPRGLALVADLLHRAEPGAEPRPWPEVAAELAVQWAPDVALDPEVWAGGACRRSEEESFSVRLAVLRGDEEVAERWFPVEVTQPCAGPLPFAVATDGDGAAIGWSRVGRNFTMGALETVPALGGVAWPCTSDVAMDATGLWLSCAGRRVAVDGLPEYAVIRPARAEDPMLEFGDVADAEGAGLPVVEDVATWRGPFLPPRELLAPRAFCALPETSEPGTEAPPRPDWLPPGVEPSLDVVADADRSGAPDRVLVVPGAGDDPPWLLVAFGEAVRRGAVWVQPLPEELAPDALPAFGVGCALAPMPPPPEEAPSSGEETPAPAEETPAPAEETPAPLTGGDAPR